MHISDYIQLNDSVGKFCDQSEFEKKKFAFMCGGRHTHTNASIGIHINHCGNAEYMHVRHFTANARRSERVKKSNKWCHEFSPQNPQHILQLKSYTVRNSNANRQHTEWNAISKIQWCILNEWNANMHCKQSQWTIRTVFCLLANFTHKGQLVSACARKAHQKIISVEI